MNKGVCANTTIKNKVIQRARARAHTHTENHGYEQEFQPSERSASSKSLTHTLTESFGFFSSSSHSGSQECCCASTHTHRLMWVVRPPADACVSWEPSQLEQTCLGSVHWSTGPKQKHHQSYQLILEIQDEKFSSYNASLERGKNKNAHTPKYRSNKN